MASDAEHSDELRDIFENDPDKQSDFALIRFDELQLREVLGRGAYGVVQKAVWRDRVVAVKVIENQREIKEFKREVAQLARVQHENIVRLYGACTVGTICLVMEYAEGGSLYNVLHGSPTNTRLPAYTAGHAISWCYQCALGVEYLHGMKKPLVHRDLKPPNLLLIDQGRVLKICDFGTACDKQTYMTNNKGSAAWMAPEVFRGTKYGEKCDVFSWGIIFWEVLSRRRPFEQNGGNAYQILWAIHQGRRPPLLEGMPRPLEILMVRCWNTDAAIRPEMKEISRILKFFVENKVFRGAKKPLVYPDDAVEPRDSTFSLTSDSFANEPTDDFYGESTLQLQETTRNNGGRGDSSSGYDSGTILDKGQPVPLILDKRAAPVKITAEYSGEPGQLLRPSGASAPRKLNMIGGSHGDLPSAVLNQETRKKSAPEPQPVGGTSGGFKKGHRRISSFDSAIVNKPIQEDGREQVANAAEAHSPERPAKVSFFDRFKNRTGLKVKIGQPGQDDDHRLGGRGSGDDWTLLDKDDPQDTEPTRKTVESPQEEKAYLCIPVDLQPIPPDRRSKQSMTIYSEHCDLAKEYLKLEEQYKLLRLQRQELIAALSDEVSQEPDTGQIEADYERLLAEKKQLLELNKRLKHKTNTHKKSVGR